MTYTIPNFEITKDVLDFLFEQRQLNGGETAGILMGSEFDDNSYRINKASYPYLSQNSSSRCGCTRDASSANDFIQREYKISNKTRFYIGEWHTHPEDDPTPSYVDLCSIREISNTGEFPTDFIILIIIGLQKLYFTCYIKGKFMEFTPTVV